MDIENFEIINTKSFLTFLKYHPTHNKERNLLRKRIKIYYLLGWFLRGAGLYIL